MVTHACDSRGTAERNAIPKKPRHSRRLIETLQHVQAHRSHAEAQKGATTARPAGVWKRWRAIRHALSEPFEGSNPVPHQDNVLAGDSKRTRGRQLVITTALRLRPLTRRRSRSIGRRHWHRRRSHGRQHVCNVAVAPACNHPQDQGGRAAQRCAPQQRQQKTPSPPRRRRTRGGPIVLLSCGGYRLPPCLF